MKILKRVLMMSLVLLCFGCNKENADSTVLTEMNKLTEDYEDSMAENSENPDVETENDSDADYFDSNDCEYYIVNSEEGLNVRENPDLSARKIAGLTDKTTVKLLQLGEEITIDGITSQWLEIELPEEVAEKANAKSGWVFGGYMAKSQDISIPSKYYKYSIDSQTGMATIGSYIKPHKNEKLVMYSSASEKSKQISTFSGKDSGIILRAAGNRYLDDGCWYYISNQTKGTKGWIFGRFPFYSTANGFEISAGKKQYIRKNADVIIEETNHKSNLGYLPRVVLSADNIHYIARVTMQKNWSSMTGTMIQPKSNFFRI